MGRFAQASKIAYVVTIIATLTLLFNSFLFAYRNANGKYHIAKKAIHSTFEKHRKMPERIFTKHEISQLFNSALSKYQEKSSLISNKVLTRKTEETEENKPPVRTLNVANVNKTHFILNNAVNPVYQSGRCVVRVLMFMLRKMIRRIGKLEGTYHCPELNCDYEISYSTAYEALADKHIVILFLRTKWEWADLHAARPPNQIWIMYARESPSYDHCIVPEDQWYNTSYNWTMTYHEDAHFSVPYGRYIPNVPTVPVDDNRNWAKGKNKFSAWMASNCGISTYNRVALIKKLSKHFQIDTYGRCGTMHCPKDNFEECDRILSRHKFYFSLENAECDQYITEKLWRNAFLNDIVPIVYGAPKRDYERFCPPNSFIYLGDFSSHHRLTSYLTEIDRNDTLYNSFFEWKKHGSIELINFQTIFSDPSVCKLVTKYLQIRRKDPADIPDVMPDLNTWWKDTCHENENIKKLIHS